MFTTCVVTSCSNAAGVCTVLREARALHVISVALVKARSVFCQISNCMPCTCCTLMPVAAAHQHPDVLPSRSILLHVSVVSQAACVNCSPGMLKHWVLLLSGSLVMVQQVTLLFCACSSWSCTSWQTRTLSMFPSSSMALATPMIRQESDTDVPRAQVPLPPCNPDPVNCSLLCSYASIACRPCIAQAGTVVQQGSLLMVCLSTLLHARLHES